MHQVTNTDFSRYRTYLVVAALALLIPALTINLGNEVIKADEKYRALIALEMEISGDWLKPTINGESYYKKPPLYNWVLLGLFHLTDSHEEWVIRIPVVVSLLGFALTVFFTARKYLDTITAYIAAMALITAQRILFYDSMVGLIDVLFSWVTYVQVYVIVHFYERKKLGKLFLLSYALAAVGFMLKGLPSIAFQGISILTVFLLHRNIKGLFSGYNFLGIAVFLTLVGRPFLTYELNYGTTENWMKLFTESSVRYENSTVDFLMHLLAFPVVDIVFPLLPWGLFLVFFIRRSPLAAIKGNRFLVTIGVLFLTNILLYWFAPGTHPRYLFMLYPYVLIIGVHLYRQAAPEDWRKKVVDHTQGAAIAIFGVGCLVFAFLELPPPHTLEPQQTIYLIAACPVFLGLWFLHKKWVGLRLELLVIALLVARIVFDLVVLEVRTADYSVVKYSKFAEEIVRMSEDKPIVVVNPAPLNEDLSYYIESGKGQIIHREKNVDSYQSGVDYIIDKRYIDSTHMEVLYLFTTKYQNWHLALVRTKEE